jgi:hypothetical protein
MIVTSLLAAVVSLGLGGFGRIAQEQTIIATGEWSKPVEDNRGRALRGRLVLGERYFAERRETVVYVELQDASESVGGALRVFCDLGKHDFRPENKSGLVCELRDGKKRPVPSAPQAFGGATPRSEWITLPSDGTIRLRASPFGITRTNARAICPHLGSFWVIADDDFQDYSLSGTFTVAPEEKRMEIDGDHVWRGTIELPAIKISNKRK